MSKDNKKSKEKAVNPEKPEVTVDKEEPEKRGKVKKHSKKHGHKAAGTANQPAAITAVEVLSIPSGQPASGSFEPSTGQLTLSIPQPAQGQAGPAGPQGPEGKAGPEGKTGQGVHYSRIADRADDFFLFIDETGRLGYSAEGVVSFVQLASADQTSCQGSAQA